MWILQRRVPSLSRQSSSHSSLRVSKQVFLCGVSSSVVGLCREHFPLNTEFDGNLSSKLLFVQTGTSTNT